MSNIPYYKRIFYGIRRRIAEYTFRPHIIEREHRGHTIKLSIKDLFGKGWYGEMHREWPELNWIADHGVKQGDFVIDCGANNGFTSILFAKYAGSNGKVIAIEPVPHNVRIIQENISLNEVTNCELVACGAGSAEDTIEMIDMPNGTMLTELVAKGKKIQVPVKTIDSIANGRKVNFLKVDVEGFELEVLRGAKEVLKDRPAMDLELHISYFDDPLKEIRAILDLIDLDHYRIFLQLDVDGPILEQNQPYENLDLAIASRDNVHMYLC